MLYTLSLSNALLKKARGAGVRPGVKNGVTVDRSNEEWVAALGTTGPEQDLALRDLRGIIRSGLPYMLSKWLSPDDPNFDALADDVVQETLLRVLDHIRDFEGRSKFTTWVYKIAVRNALTELRRKRWQDVSLEGMLESEEGPAVSWLLADSSAGPDSSAEQSDMFARLRRIIQEELTEKQRTALVAARIKGIPLEEVARRMGMNRNALYKLLHDARLRLKRRLQEEGLPIETILASFEK